MKMNVAHGGMQFEVEVKKISSDRIEFVLRSNDFKETAHPQGFNVHYDKGEKKPTIHLLDKPNKDNNGFEKLEESPVSFLHRLVIYEIADVALNELRRNNRLPDFWYKELVSRHWRDI